MNKLEKAILMGLILTIGLSMVSFADTCNEINDRVLRLHILANSDSEEDQLVKLAVRDKLLQDVPELFEEAEDKETAIAAATACIGKIEESIRSSLTEQGVEAVFAVEIVENQYFDQREYDTFTMPAGYYAALRVTLGEGAGQNWWCVMYPPLCGKAARASVEESFTDRQSRLLSSDGKFEIKFRLYEWLRSWITRG